MQGPGTGESWLERQSLGAAQECQLHAVGTRRGGNPAQLGKLPLAGGDDELAAAPMGDGALATELVQALAARDAQKCLEGAAGIVEAGVDPLVVAGAGAGAEAPGGLENQAPAPPQRDSPRPRNPAPPRPDHDHIRVVHSPPV